MCKHTYHHYATCGHIACFTLDACIEQSTSIRSRSPVSGHQIDTAHGSLPLSQDIYCLQCEFESIDGSNGLMTPETECSANGTPLVQNRLEFTTLGEVDDSLGLITGEFEALPMPGFEGDYCLPGRAFDHDEDVVSPVPQRGFGPVSRASAIDPRLEEPYPLSAHPEDEFRGAVFERDSDLVLRSHDLPASEMYSHNDQGFYEVERWMDNTYPNPEHGYELAGSSSQSSSFHGDFQVANGFDVFEDCSTHNVDANPGQGSAKLREGWADLSEREHGDGVVRSEERSCGWDADDESDGEVERVYLTPPGSWLQPPSPESGRGMGTR
ncbi:hypothetical protein BJX70DRAFT_355493 [Aspergillus crustosus]